MTPPVAEIGVITGIRQLSLAAWQMEVKAATVAQAARAGQFVHLRVSHTFQPMLRRPMSVGPVCQGELRLIFAVRGAGTRALTQKLPGEDIDLIGPLGKPFPLPTPGAEVVMVAGGIGVVPLLLLDDQLPPGTSKTFLLGVRSASLLTVPEDEIKARGIVLATDDGTMGVAGSVLDLLERHIKRSPEVARQVYACGPPEMLRRLKEFCAGRRIPAQVSLEVPMGCGLGACQSCAVPRADGTGYLLVCRDGPAFDATEVDLSPEHLLWS